MIFRMRQKNIILNLKEKRKEQRARFETWEITIKQLSTWIKKQDQVWWWYSLDLKSINASSDWKIISSKEAKKR